jgi:uncharacterized RDD family membrane protein YckC
MEWYYAQEGEAKGPVSDEQLTALVAAGTVTAQTLVWNPSMRDWRPYGKAQSGPAPASGAPPPPAAVSASQEVYGGFWIRAAAKILDGLVKSAILIVAQIVFAIAGGAFGVVVGGGTSSTGAEIAWMLGGMLFFLLQFAFDLAYDTWFIGRFAATPGKMVCGLKVVTSDGGRVTYWRALGRRAAEYVSMLTCYIGYIIAAFDSEKRALHDHICSTRVVRK